MKLIATLILGILMGFSTWAQSPPTPPSMDTAIIIGFGQDGATAEIRPNPHSQQDALEIFEALNVPLNRAKKTLKGDSFEIESFEDNMALVLLLTENSVIANPPLDYESDDRPLKRGDIQFTGPAAQALYEVLTVPSQIKKVGNLTCSLAKDIKYECVLLDVEWLVMNP